MDPMTHVQYLMAFSIDAMLLAAAPLAAATVVGLLISILQAVTQIQDQTLAQTAKIAVIAATMVLFGGLLEAELLRDQIRNMGFPETKSRKVVDTCLQRPEGTPVPQSIHKDLAAGIARMFK